MQLQMARQMSKGQNAQAPAQQTDLFQKKSSAGAANASLSTVNAADVSNESPIANVADSVTFSAADVADLEALEAQNEQLIASLSQ